MENQIQELGEQALGEIAKAVSEQEIENIRVKFFGKNGKVSQIMRNMKDVAPEDRPHIGKVLNETRQRIESEITHAMQIITMREINMKLASEAVDVSIPAKPLYLGNLHPLNIVRRKIVDFFSGLGFSVVDGPEIDTAYYNFEALNIPADHPARDSQDTFFITENFLLRSQTSTSQIRVMEKQSPPIRILSPGRVFRGDEPDATHNPVFHQIEGLVVDKGITMCDLKGVLELFIRHIMGKEMSIRFRPSFFPFTEPSVEVDASCPKCMTKGCSYCKGSGFIELLGAGIVNRRVLLGCNIDPDVYSGFAFGIGLDRITQFLFAISDSRNMFENDIRFLKQFS